MGEQALSIAELAIYLILFQPTFYCLWKHGKHGFLGWLCVQSFCTVRIVGNAIQIHTNATGTVAVLLSSIGLAPLLLATVGILHESRIARNPNLRSKLEWGFVFHYHLLVTAGLVMVIIGIVHLINGEMGNSTKILLRVGIAVVVLCWGLLFPWIFISFTPRQRDKNAPAYAEGTLLLYGVTAALPFLGCREIYAACSLLIGSIPDSSTFARSLPAKVCLSVVPEMIVTIIYIAVGLRTHNIKKSFKV